MAAAERPLLAVEDLAKTFDVSRPWLARKLAREPRLGLKAVDGVSYAIRRGETFSLVGESGCGKSTVARLIVGLYTPTRGRILFEGTDLAGLRRRRALAPFRRRMQMIFQDPYASLNPRWRVRDIVAEPIRAFGALNGTAGLDARVAELLEQVGLGARDGARYPHEFSGGQRQRISIARALAGNPEFLVCDEPTSALDVSVQAQILNLMTDLQDRLGLTYLFISHNLAVVDHVSDDIGVMYLGRLAELAPARELFLRPRHPYTRLLLDTIPDLSMSGRERTPVGGEVPSPIHPPPGCAFHPRCPFANARCRSEIPALRPAGAALVACHAVEEGRLPDVERPGTGFWDKAAALRERTRDRQHTDSAELIREDRDRRAGLIE
jgi:peptide/nickel transport system ATP-binding protein